MGSIVQTVNILKRSRKQLTEVPCMYSEGDDYGRSIVSKRRPINIVLFSNGLDTFSYFRTSRRPCRRLSVSIRTDSVAVSLAKTVDVVLRGWAIDRCTYVLRRYASLYVRRVHNDGRMPTVILCCVRHFNTLVYVIVSPPDNNGYVGHDIYRAARVCVWRV